MTVLSHYLHVKSEHDSPPISLSDLLAWVSGTVTPDREAAIRADLHSGRSDIQQLLDKSAALKELVASTVAKPKSEMVEWLEANKEYCVGPLTEEQRSGMLALERVLASEQAERDSKERSSNSAQKRELERRRRPFSGQVDEPLER